LIGLIHQLLYVIFVGALFEASEMMNFHIRQFIESARSKLEGIDQDLYKKQEDSDLVRAAVLIPITVWENKIVILFTKRTNSVNNHQNQISFPGGRIEKKDADPLDAALRETEEEIGIKKKDIEILGVLKTGKTTTGFYIYPFVGFIHNLQEIQINKSEVERIIYIPLNWLREPENSHTEIYKGENNRGHPVIAFLVYDSEKVWGVTASLVKLLLELIKINSEADRFAID